MTIFWVRYQSFAPSDMNFQTIWIPKVILTKILLQKSWSSRTILILGMHFGGNLELYLNDVIDIFQNSGPKTIMSEPVPPSLFLQGVPGN